MSDSQGRGSADQRASIQDVIEQDASPETARAFLKLATDYLEQTRDGEGGVSTALNALTIAERFDEPLPQEGHAAHEIIARVEREIIADSNRLYHPMYMGHQVSPPLPAAIWSEPLVSALNQSVAVWEMSPVGTVIEDRVIRWFTDLAGWGAAAGGTLTTGGTEATFTALLVARNVLLPDAWESGIGAEAPVLVCGEHVHYAVTRAAGELGIGMKNVIVVPSIDFRMDPRALEETLSGLASDNRRVMAVIATAGSTATGSFDDLESIGRICEARGIWLHVDGAHGASALFSATHRARLHGLNRANSIAWDPHKMMLMPLAMGALLVRDERTLDRAFSQRAPYLFHADAGTRSPDRGTRSFLCSRRADAIKLWIALQRYGARGFGELYDMLCSRCAQLHEEIERRPDFENLHVPHSNILCFRYVGDGSASAGELDTLNKMLRERYNRSGAGWITTTLLNGRRVLRVTIMNPRTEVRHLHALLDGLRAEAESLRASA